MQDYYVYLLLDPRKFYQPFYIGKGRARRAYSHLNEKDADKSENVRKFNTIQAIRSKGFEPVVSFWQTNMSENDAYDLEEILIKKFGRLGIDHEGILTNLLDSGRPPNTGGKPRSIETRQKISNTRKEKHIIPTAAIEAARVANKGRSPPNKGQKLDPSSISKRTATRKINGVRYNYEKMHSATAKRNRYRAKVLNSIKKIVEYYNVPFSYDLLIKARQEKVSSLSEKTLLKWLDPIEVLSFPGFRVIPLVPTPQVPN